MVHQIDIAELKYDRILAVGVRGQGSAVGVGVLNYDLSKFRTTKTPVFSG